MPSGDNNYQSGAAEPRQNRDSRDSGQQDSNVIDLIAWLTASVAEETKGQRAPLEEPRGHSISQQQSGVPMATEGELRGAEIAAAEARTDTKIARLEGKLDLVLEAVRTSREEGRDNRRAVIANGWVIFAAMIGVIAIIATVGPVLYDIGHKHDEVTTKKVQDAFDKYLRSLPAPQK